MDKPKILVVEDEEDLRRLITSFLAKKYEVAAAKDGREALDLVDKIEPNIIVTDLLMPNLHGLDLLSLIREKQIPTIVMSGVGAEYLEAAKSFGVTDTIAKPFRITELVQRISKILGE